MLIFIKWVVMPIIVLSTLLGLLTLFAVAEVNWLQWFSDRYLNESVVKPWHVLALIMAVVGHVVLFIAFVRLLRKEQE